MQIKESISINAVEGFLLNQLGWQYFPFPEKTEALDGVIEIHKNGRKIGDSIFVEIKSGKSYKRVTNKRPNYFGLCLGTESDLTRWKKIWQNIPGPIILVYVDFENHVENPTFYWTDLKSNLSYSEELKNQVLIPKLQKLTKDFAVTYKTLIDYRDFRNFDKTLPIILTDRNDFFFLSLGKPLKRDARKFYSEWGSSSICDRTNPKFGEIIVNRVGWKHITRSERRTERIIQSWLLLSIAKKIIKEITDFKRVGKTKLRSSAVKNSIVKKEYFCLRAKVIFHHRHEAVIKVILRVITETYNSSIERNNVRVWFYNVYEARRGKYEKKAIGYK